MGIVGGLSGYIGLNSALSVLISTIFCERACVIAVKALIASSSSPACCINVLIDLVKKSPTSSKLDFSPILSVEVSAMVSVIFLILSANASGNLNNNSALRFSKALISEPITPLPCASSSLALIVPPSSNLCILPTAPPLLNPTILSALFSLLRCCSPILEAAFLLITNSPGVNNAGTESSFFPPIAKRLVSGSLDPSAFMMLSISFIDTSLLPY